jgi:hypothetical protein
LHHLWCWITANAQAITAIAAAIGALFTGLYLIATILIFNEARKSADAAQESADAATEAVQTAKDNTLAAKQSASAAQSSAGAASESAALMRQEFYEQARLGRLTVEFTIDSAVSSIEHLRRQGLGKWAVLRALPPTANLFPQKAGTAIDNAARISTNLATKLSSAFDDLQMAFDQIERLRNLVSIPGMTSDALSPAAATVDDLLRTALTKFMEAKALLPIQALRP